jgi:hypothetical protein
VGTNSGNNGITIAGGTTGLSSIYFADGTTGNEAFRGYIEYGHSSDALSFGTAASTRLTIASTGAATFSSSVTATTGLTVGSLGSGSDAIITLATNASGAPRTIYYKASTATINFTGTGGTDLMTLTNGGNLGIGTTSPSRNLTVKQSVNSYLGGFSVERNDNNNYLGIFNDGSIWNIAASYLSGGSYQPIGFFTSDVERMRITSGGNVGIGTTTPGSKLSIVGLPTSSSGLSSGDIWNDSGTLKIV